MKGSLGNPTACSRILLISQELLSMLEFLRIDGMCLRVDTRFGG